MELKKKASLAAVFFTFFLDNLCWSIVFPILAPYFLDLGNPLFPSGISSETRTLWLGVCIAVFSFGQFLGGPLIGEYADRHGRKMAFLVTVFCTCIGVALTALSVYEYWLFPLLFVRFATGFFSGNTGICLASIADLSEDLHSKAKHFGYLALTAGFSFLLGAFLGGKLSDPTVYAGFRPDVPLWIAAFLSALNFLFLLFFFRETAEIDPNAPFRFWEGFRNIRTALQTERIKGLYLIFFLFSCSWTLLFQFTPVLFVERFQFTNSDLGNLALYMGVGWMIGSGYLNKKLLRFLHPSKTLEAALLIFTALSLVLAYSSQFYMAVAIIGAGVVIGGIAWPVWTSLASSTAPASMQGKILGMTQSTQSIAMAVAPLCGGFVYQISLEWVFFLGAGASLVSAIVYFSLKK